MKLTYKDLAAFYRCSIRTAQARKKEIIKALGLKNKHINIYHLSAYEGVAIKDIHFEIGVCS